MPGVVQGEFLRGRIRQILKDLEFIVRGGIATDSRVFTDLLYRWSLFMNTIATFSFTTQENGADDLHHISEMAPIYIAET